MKTRDCPLIKGRDNLILRDFDGRLQTEVQHICLHCPFPDCIKDSRRRLTRRERGRLGGYVTLIRHKEKMSEWGAKGGKVCQENLKRLREDFKLLVEQQNKKGAGGILMPASPQRSKND
jgi:hypothetical protein